MTSSSPGRANGALIATAASGAILPIACRESIPGTAWLQNDAKLGKYVAHMRRRQGFTYGTARGYSLRFGTLDETLGRAHGHFDGWPRSLRRSLVRGGDGRLR